MYWSQVRVLAGPPRMNRILNYKFKISFIALIIFTIFLLFEGFFWYYSSKLSWFCFDTLSFSDWCVDDYVDKKYKTQFDKKTIAKNIIDIFNSDKN